MHSKMFNYSSLIRSPAGLLRPPSLELVPVVLRDPAPALFMRRFKNRRVPALHPVTTHGFAAVVLLVEGSEAHDVALQMRQNDSATLNDIRETVATLEDTQRTARRVLGSAHPLSGLIERDLQKARAALRARETPGSA